MSIQSLDLLYDKISESYEKVSILNLEILFGNGASLLRDLVERFARGSITENDFIEFINDRFKGRILPSILPKLIEYAILGVRFGSVQLNDIYRGKVNKSDLGLKSLHEIKQTETIIIDWSLVENDVVDYIGNVGIDRSWYGQFTSLILQTNSTMISDELTRFVRGESDLTNLHNNLTRLLYSDERAKRIIRTSMTDVFAAGQQTSFREAGTQKNRWYSKNDKRVCPFCQPLHGRTVDIGQPFDGSITRPPYHVGCRCYLSPVPLTQKELFENIDKLLEKRKQNTPQSIVSSVYDKVNSLHSEYKTKIDNLGKESADLRSRIEKLSLESINETDRKKRDKLSKQLYKLQGEYYVKDNDKRTLSKEFLKKHEELITLPDDRKSDIKLTGNLNNRHLSDVKSKIDSVLDKSLFNTTIDVDIDNSRLRAYTYEGQKTIFISDSTSAHTIAHEIGHLIEHENVDYHKRFRKFVDDRTVGEVAVQLKVHYNDPGYDDAEIAKIDRFIHAYIGKEYLTNSTEVLSMGLEMLLYEPMKMLEDKEFYRLILSFVHNQTY